MSDAFWAEFFGNLPTLLAAVGALIVALRTKKQTEVTAAKVDSGMKQVTAMARGMSERVMAREEAREDESDPM
jgi:hypothetical protein